MIIERLFTLMSHYWWALAGSVIFLLAVLFIVPLMIISLPVDYFASEKAYGLCKKFKYPLNILMISVKNVAGIILFCSGVILLFIPGQGLLTIFTGLMLMNFPGKRKLLLSIVRRKPVLKAINWIRLKAGKEPIVDIFQLR